MYIVCVVVFLGQTPIYEPQMKNLINISLSIRINSLKTLKRKEELSTIMKIPEQMLAPLNFLTLTDLQKLHVPWTFFQCQFFCEILILHILK